MTVVIDLPLGVDIFEEIINFSGMFMSEIMLRLYIEFRVRKLSSPFLNIVFNVEYYNGSSLVSRLMTIFLFWLRFFRAEFSSLVKL